MSVKKEKFIKIASNRVNKIIYYLDLLGNCSNTDRYQYDEKDIVKMFNAIEEELKFTKNKFKIAKSKKQDFRF